MFNQNLMNKLKSLFVDNDKINKRAKKIQDIDPDKFRLILQNMIYHEIVSEEYFDYLDKEIETDDNYDVVLALNDYMMRLEEKVGLFGLTKEQKADVLDVIDKACSVVYGFSETEIFDIIDKSKLPEEVDIGNEYVDSCDQEGNRLDYLSELDKKDMRHIINTYLKNYDCTCMYSIFIELLKKPELCRFIPFNHIVKLGLNGAISPSLNPLEDVEDFQYRLAVITTVYTTYNKETCEKFKNQIEDVIVVEKDKIDELRRCYGLNVIKFEPRRVSK